MGLEYIHSERGIRRMSGEMVVIDRHLYLTEDKSRVVEEGDVDGRWLWASPGQEIAKEEAERLGAVKPAPKPAAAKPPAAKQQAPRANKQRAKPEDKAAE